MITLTENWAHCVVTKNLFKLYKKGRIGRHLLDKKLKEIRQEKPLPNFINRLEEEHERHT